MLYYRTIWTFTSAPAKIRSSTQSVVSDRSFPSHLLQAAMSGVPPAMSLSTTLTAPTLSHGRLGLQEQSDAPQRLPMKQHSRTCGTYTCEGVATMIYRPSRTNLTRETGGSDPPGRSCFCSNAHLSTSGRLCPAAMLTIVSFHDVLVSKGTIPSPRIRSSSGILQAHRGRAAATGAAAVTSDPTPAEGKRRRV